MTPIQPGFGSPTHLPALRSKPQRAGRTASMPSLSPGVSVEPPSMAMFGAARPRQLGAHIVMRGFVFGLVAWAAALFAISFMPGT